MSTTIPLLFTLVILLGAVLVVLTIILTSIQSKKCTTNELKTHLGLDTVESWLFAWEDGKLLVKPTPIHTIWDRDTPPNHVSETASREFGRNPYLIHSFSWRQNKDQGIFSYIVLCRSFHENCSFDIVDKLVPDAPSTAKEAPPNIKYTQVVSHGLRHLFALSQSNTKEGREISNAIPQEMSYWLKENTSVDHFIQS